MRRILTILCVSTSLVAGIFLSRGASADDIAERAKKLHFSSIVLDTHDDTTQRFFSKRSEEHTSELQSLTNLVCRLLLEKKKKTKTLNNKKFSTNTAISSSV